MTNKLNWAKIVRQNTGKACMDSGGDNGRHWQQPLQRKAIELWGSKERNELYGRIALQAYLTEHFEIEHLMTEWLRTKCEDENTWNYQAYADFLAEYLGLEVLTSDYTYNWENDLSQDFQFSVIGPKNADWLYSEECFVIIESHNGADARGGFSDPVVCKAISEHAWLDVVCGVILCEGIDSNGEKIDHNELQKLDEKFQIGYSNNPTCEFNKEIAKVLKMPKTKNAFKVLLKSGEIVEGYFYFRGSNGNDIA